MRSQKTNKKTEEDCVVPSSQWICYPSWRDGSSEESIHSGIIYQTSEELDEEWKWFGKVTSYPGSGYAVDLPSNETSALLTLGNLMSQDFIDRAARLVVLDFSTYNPSLNLHSVGRLAFETHSTGGFSNF